MFDDAFAQPSLKSIKDYSGYGGARSMGKEGGSYGIRLFQDRVGSVKMVRPAAIRTPCLNGMPVEKLPFSLKLYSKKCLALMFISLNAHIILGNQEALKLLVFIHIRSHNRGWRP